MKGGSKMKFVFRVEGIDCANCGAKIERALENDKLFDEAYLNFMLKKIEVHTKETDEKVIEERVRQIATRVESGVELTRIDTGYRGVIEVQEQEGKHEETCGCGEHHHEHKHEAKQEEACGCGGHHHEDEHEVKCEESCGCGEHHHEHKHEVKQEEACGCGGHHHEHKHEHEVKCEESCGCGGHDHEHYRGETKKSVVPVGGCGCGCTDPKPKEKEHNMLVRIVCAMALLLFGSIANLDIFIFVSYIVIGYDIILKAATNIIKGKVFDENFLMTIATVAAFVIGEYPEAVAVMLFYQVGEYFQSKAVAKSRKAIEGLMDIKPEFARVKQNGNWVVVTPEVIKVGDIIAVRPGEKIPLDGVIVKGTTTIDHSALTGESLPVLAEENSEVLSGSINIEQLIEVRVTQVLRDSTVSKILDLIENATSKKAQTEKFITKFAAVYTPIVVIAAVLIAIIPSLLTGDWNHWIYTSIVFLVISCPCALVVSIPLSFFGGIGAASKQGVLIKGSNYLERLNEVDTFVMDKTGTITKGAFEVIGTFPAKKGSEEDLIRYAVQIERHSNHPIAKAIANYKTDIVEAEMSAFTEKAGYGLSAVIEGKQVIAGNERFMSEENISYKVPKMIGTSVHVAVDGQYLGCMIVADVVKEESKAAIKALKEKGIKKVIMLTGDKKEVADYIAEEVGVDDAYAGLLPQDKVAKVQELIDKGDKVAFVGDGINDAPVLALADLGIAMGGIGSDAAVEASDVVLMQDNLMQVVKGMDIAKQTERIVKQNIVFALGTKFIVMLLGIFGIANMWLAVFADVGVSIIAILNAIRILPQKKNK